MDLVLLHAFPSDARLFAPQQAEFPGRLHTPDLPGFGSNLSAPAHSVDAMAEAIHEYVKGLGLGKFVLGGVSMGGYVALAYVRRFGTRQLSGMVLAHTRADADSPEMVANRNAQLALLAAGGKDEFIEKQLSRMFTPAAPAFLLDETRALMQAQPVGTISAAVEALRDRPDSFPTLTFVDVPTLVLAGENDVVAPANVTRPMCDAIRRGRYARIARAGHLANLEQPAAWNEALHGFLKAL